MYYLKLKPGEVKFIKFEDLKYKKKVPYLQLYRLANSSHHFYKLNKDLLNLIIKLRSLKSANEPKAELRTNPISGKLLEGTYMFPKGKNYVNDILSSKFDNEITDFQLSSTTILDACTMQLEGYDMYKPLFDD